MGLLKRCFFTGSAFLSTLASINLLICISMNSQECGVRPQIVNVNSKEPVIFPFSIRTSKCSDSCNNINDPFAKLRVPDIFKNLNVKVFNLMSRNDETRHIEWHERWKFKCRLDACVCNNKQRWNDDKCRWECKELIDKGVCDKESICNPSNCECEWNKSCDVGEYLDYENCKCRKKLADKLVEEFTENVEEEKIAGMALFEHENECVCSYTICVVLGVTALTISIGICAYFAYKYMNRNRKIATKESLNYQTTSY